MVKADRVPIYVWFRYLFSVIQFVYITIFCKLTVDNKINRASLYFMYGIKVQSTFAISNSKGLSEILPDIRTSTYQICRIEEKIIRTTLFNKYICNWTLEVRDILGAIYSLFHNFVYLLLEFHV